MLADSESWQNAIRYQPNEQMQILLPEMSSSTASAAPAEAMFPEETETQNMSAAQPLHIQRLEASLNMDHFISSSQSLLHRSLTSSEESSDSDDHNGAGQSRADKGTFFFFQFGGLNNVC